jgi:hypothetical protein
MIYKGNSGINNSVITLMLYISTIKLSNLRTYQQLMIVKDNLLISKRIYQAGSCSWIKLNQNKSKLVSALVPMERMVISKLKTLNVNKCRHLKQLKVCPLSDNLLAILLDSLNNR